VLRRREERKAATEERRIASQERRAAAEGDFIRGAPAPTPFVASLDTGIEPGYRLLRPVEFDESADSETGVGASLAQASQAQEARLQAQDSTQGETDVVSRESPSTAPKPHLLNHFVELSELDANLASSRELTAPHISPDRSIVDPTLECQKKEAHAQQHAVRAEALKRIFAPENASARERLLLNKRRCVERFGRHNTDQTFPLPEPMPGNPDPTRKERIGPDTGSSEVQIAILTAKIRALADKFESTEGRYDWANKRNLRLLLHRRQKLLKYFEKKDRGGKRWQHLIESLGLTEATWKGEIEVR
jgi:ribosomal protein S15